MWNTERSSRKSVLRYLVTALLWTSPPLAAQETVPLTLSAALEAARESNPLARAAALRIQEADGNLTQAAVLLVNNPEVSAYRGRRSTGNGAGGFSREFELGIEQRIEIAGQRGKRIGVARAELEAVQGERSNTERTVALAVATTFYGVLASQERLELAERGVQPIGRVAIGRVHFDGALEKCTGTHQLTPFLVNQPQMIMNVGRHGIVLQGMLIRGDSLSLLLGAG